MTNETEIESYSEWTVADLKEEINDRGLSAPSGAVKADLVQILESDDAGDETEEDVSGDESETAEFLHPYGTCVPLGPCPHRVGAEATDDETEDDDETDDEYDPDDDEESVTVHNE